MQENGTFVIEKRISLKDAMGNPSEGWLSQSVLTKGCKSYDRGPDADIVYWLLTELAKVK